MSKAESFNISKTLVFEAYKAVKANRGSAGVDEISLNEFDKNLKNNLYKIWNRMTSGTYFPKPVKAVEIPKKDGGIIFFTIEYLNLSLYLAIISLLCVCNVTILLIELHDNYSDTGGLVAGTG
jgi:hypothetical protein